MSSLFLFEFRCSHHLVSSIRILLSFETFDQISVFTGTSTRLHAPQYQKTHGISRFSRLNVDCLSCLPLQFSRLLLTSHSWGCCLRTKPSRAHFLCARPVTHGAIISRFPNIKSLHFRTHLSLAIFKVVAEKPFMGMLPENQTKSWSEDIYSKAWSNTCWELCESPLRSLVAINTPPTIYRKKTPN